MSDDIYLLHYAAQLTADDDSMKVKKPLLDSAGIGQWSADYKTKKMSCLQTIRFGQGIFRLINKECHPSIPQESSRGLPIIK